MASKKQMQQFNNKVEKYLLSIGAKKAKGGYSDNYNGFVYEIDTKGGIMQVTCHEAEKGDLFSMYVRFAELNKAKKALPNHFHQFGIGLSGKWNIHADEEESAMNCLEYRIEKTKIKEPATA